MTALVCGSLAFDTVMVFPGRFREHILADRIHMLNVSFLVPSMRRNFGGCAGNIAYNLQLLGEKGAPMGTVGHDFEPYRRWLKACNVSLDYVRELDDAFTAQAFITTDLDDNQITAFHPGAMSQSHLNAVPTTAGVTLGVVAPDGRDGMIAHAAQFAAAGIPWLFDPGQGLPMFDGEALRDFIGKATWVAVNDYEGQMLQERTGWGRGRDREEGPCLHRHQGRGWQRHPCRRQAARDPDGQAGRRSRIRPAAAMRTAPDLFLA